jgi:hypothetical protein
MVAEIIRECLADLTDADKAQEAGICYPISCKNTFTDSTCIKANIYFPVDWVLLRDAARSLILAIKTIRNHGLKNRIIEPQLFLKQMNKLSISMTHTRKSPIDLNIKSPSANKNNHLEKGCSSKIPILIKIDSVTEN